MILPGANVVCVGVGSVVVGTVGLVWLVWFPPWVTETQTENNVIPTPASAQYLRSQATEKKFFEIEEK